ncbi:MAG: hypothetical protein GQ507_00175 [Dehalococcoidales bacterium]|nr:hypothetical protein [Dehalococcoidales bacterium]
MDLSDERIREAVKHTKILRPPKQSLATFGTTNIYYYLLTEPVYKDLVEDTNETVIREGRVIAQRPKVVTPYYLSRLEGFSSEARRHFEMLTNKHGPNVAGLFYSYRNEPKELNIVSDGLLAVVDRLNTEIDKRGEPLTSIIKGEDELWDVSLMQFIYEITGSSVQNNLRQMGARGLLNIDSSGIPTDARVKIEELFRMAYAGECEPRELKDELDRWGLFEDYEDRFLALFKKR